MMEDSSKLSSATIRRNWAIGSLLVAMVVAFAAAILIYDASQRPAGPAIASIDVTPTEPFSLDTVATGERLRLWVLLKCNCFIDVKATGQMEVLANDKVIASHYFQNEDLVWDSRGTVTRMWPLLDIPEQPAGTPLTLRGTVKLERFSEFTLLALRFSIGP